MQNQSKDLFPIYNELLILMRTMGSEKPREREDSQSQFNQAFLSICSKIKESEDHEIIKELKTNIKIFLLLQLESIRWEDRWAGLYIIGNMLEKEWENSEVMWTTYGKKIENFIDDKENKVRENFALIIGKFTKREGMKIFEAFELKTKEKIKSCIKIIEEQKNNEENYKYFSDSGKEVESSLWTLTSILENLKENFALIDSQIDNILDICNICSLHSMKHIRGSSLTLIQKLIENLEIKQIEERWEVILCCLERGLSDNWTEVRFNATKATYIFLLKTKTCLFVENVRIILIPKICFNRLSPAKSFSDESLKLWKEIVGSEGKKLLAGLASETLDYYLKQSIMSNWEIRETSCKSILELLTKATHDNEEARAKLMLKNEEILIAFNRLCNDNYHSVRENALFALLEIMKSSFQILQYKDELFNIAIDHFSDSFHEARLTAIQILSFLTEIDQKQELSTKIKENIKNLFDKCSKKQNSHDHNQEKSHFHIHLGDLYDGLICYLKEILIVNKRNQEIMKKNDLIDFFINLWINNLDVVKNETSEFVKDNIYKNFSEIINLLPKQILKKNIEIILESSLFDINQNIDKKDSLITSAKEFIKNIQKIIGPNILKAKIELIDQGKYTKLFQEKLYNF